jgi:hypothetical protein
VVLLISYCFLLIAYIWLLEVAARKSIYRVLISVANSSVIKKMMILYSNYSHYQMILNVWLVVPEIGIFNYGI